MARRTGSKNHTHQYFERPDGIWACSGIDNCTHFMPSNMSPAPAGRESICYGCGEKFILTSIIMASSRYPKEPKCDDCSGEKDLAEYIEQKLRAAGALKEDPYAAFRTKPKTVTPTPKPNEPDQIEVIEPDENQE